MVERIKLRDYQLVSRKRVDRDIYVNLEGFSPCLITLMNHTKKREYPKRIDMPAIRKYWLNLKNVKLII